VRVFAVFPRNGQVTVRPKNSLHLKDGNLPVLSRVVQHLARPEAECRTWCDFLDKIMGGDKERVRFLQKSFGYALSGDAREQCFFILHGTGANRRSTMTNAVSSVAGGYSQHTPTETLLVKRSQNIPNDIARLHGARLVTAAEAECDRKLAEALTKQMTGGDKLTARFLHGEWFEFVPTFKVFLAVNHKPQIQGTDYAMWRRIRLIPFDVTIPDDEQDKTLPTKLEVERAGILRWLVEGCLAWQQEGLTPPQAVITATAEYREEMDSVGAFIEECCVRDPEVNTSARVLYAHYLEWCKTHEEVAIGPNAVGARLGEKSFRPKRTKSARCWNGLGLVTQG
jgi:putative DNA primase/helicase